MPMKHQIIVFHAERVTKSESFDNQNLLTTRSSTDAILDVKYFLWGLDLSGTVHGAGGVGGLLAQYSSDATYLPCYDAAGNIYQYQNTNGTLLFPTRCQNYDPYGNSYLAGIVVPFWFSTKYLDVIDSGMYYYGHRYYHPYFGRWISRDPLEEEGGLNLYAFCENDPVNKWDYLGLWIIERDGEAWATACAEQGDTFDSLGLKISLDTTDYEVWAHTVDKEPKVGKKYNIPRSCRQ